MDYGIHAELARREKRAFFRWLVILAVVVAAWAWR